MIGHFQLFAEPYVMTQGGPLRSHGQRGPVHVRGRLQVVEPGLRRGRGLRAVRSSSFATLLQLRVQRREAATNRGRVVLLHVINLVARSAALTLFPLVWMVSASFMAPGRPARSRRHCGRGDVTLDNYQALFVRLDLARYRR
jgi:hypothetical protein